MNEKKNSSPLSICRVVNRQWTLESSPLVSNRPKLPTPSRSNTTDTNGCSSSSSSNTLPPHASFSHSTSRGDGASGPLGGSASSFAPNIGNLMHASSETASTDSSESNVEMQVTRSGEQSRQFVVGRPPRDLVSNNGVSGGSGASHSGPNHVLEDRAVSQRPDPSATLSSSASTPASPCKLGTPTGDHVRGATFSAHPRRETDLCEAMAEMSTSCPSGGDANPSSLHGSVKQKCKMLIKRKGKTEGKSDSGDANNVVPSCLGGDIEDEQASHDAGDDGDDGPSAACVGRNKSSDDPAKGAATTSTTSKNHGYAAPLPTEDKSPAQKVTSPALPQTPPPAIGSSSQQLPSNGALIPPSGATGAVSGHSGGAKAKLKHFTSFFSRSRRRGKSVSSSSAGAFEGEAVLGSDQAPASSEDHLTKPSRPPPDLSGLPPGDCGVCSACESGVFRRPTKCSASSKLLSVVGHLTGSPVRRPSAHAAAPPGRHPHLLESCWGRAGGMTASDSRDSFSSSAAAPENNPTVDPAECPAMRRPLPEPVVGFGGFLDNPVVLPPRLPDFSLFAANPSLAELTSRPQVFRNVLVNPNGREDEMARAVCERTANRTANVARGNALTSETQKSEYGSLGPDGRLIPRTVHTQIDYMHHLVNDLKEISACSFYWGVMDRYEAERLLDNKPEGTFLLRDSAQEDFLFSVSFRRYGRSLHARIEQWQHKFSFDALDPGVFSSDTVCGLIEHYKDPSCCMFFEPMLTIPLNRSFVFSLQHLCRATICKNLTYDGINLLQLPNVSKDYLKYYHYKQKIRERRYETNVPQ